MVTWIGVIISSVF